MKIGALKHRIQLQTVAKTAGASQTMTLVYTTFATVWGKLEPVRIPAHLLQMSDEKPDSGPTHRVHLRYRTDVDSSMFVWYDGRRFEIRKVGIVNEENKFLTLLVSEREEDPVA